MKEGKYISFDLITKIRVGCPHCEAERVVNYYEDAPNEEHFICGVCTKDYVVRFWDEYRDEALEPLEG